MSDFYVETINPEVSELIQKHAFNLGYEWRAHGKSCCYTGVKYLTFECNNIYYSYREPRNKEKLSLEEFFNLEDKSKTFMLGEYKAVYEDGHLTVDGEVSISKEQIRDLYAFYLSPTINIEGFVVCRKDDGIQFGCTFIPKEQVEELFKLTRE